jgi:hypothetical protein
MFATVIGFVSKKLPGLDWDFFLAAVGDQKSSLNMFFLATHSDLMARNKHHWFQYSS